jgi:hypothetical protein
MILDRLFQFTGFPGGTAPAVAGNADGSDSPTTGTQASSGIVDIGVGFAAGTAPNGNPFGLAIPGNAAGGGARDLGIGDDPALKLLVEVIAPFAAGTSLQINIQGAPDNGSGAPGTFTVYASGPVVLLANIVPGTHLFDIDIPRPAPGVALPRFLELGYVSVGTFTGGGSIKAWAVLDRADQIVSPTGALSGYVPGITIPN